MRRFSTAAAAAILLFTANSFAKYDPWTCAETHTLKNSYLQCVSCGIQTHYRNTYKQEVVPSEKWLMTLGAGARSFRSLNPGEKGIASENIVTQPRARINYQKTVISQIQAYSFCTTQYEKKGELTDINTFLTDYENSGSKTEQKRIARVLGFDPSVLSPGDSRDAFKSLVYDVAYTNEEKDATGRVTKPRSSMYDRRRAFNENANELLSRKDVKEGLRDCLNEMKNRARAENPTDQQSFQLCKTMVDSCDIPDADFCNNGLDLTVKQGGSGSSSQGQPKPATQQQNRLAPPPPAYAPVQ